jgi:glutamate-1-semialdehyde 2,1-aminomutase
LLQRDSGVYSRLHDLGHALRARVGENAEAAGFAGAASGPGAVFHFGFVRASARRERGIVSTRNYRDVLRNYDTETYGRFVRGMADRGVRLIGRGIWYLSTAHTKADIEQTLGAAQETFTQMAHDRQGASS